MTARAPVAASAPGRAGLIGNPSDMYGGSVIAIAIPRRAYVTLRPAPRLRLAALDAGLDVTVRSREDLRLTPRPSAADAQRLDDRAMAAAFRSTYLNVLKTVAAARGLAEARVELRCWSDIPPSAGLSSSSALLVAALRAVDAWLGRQPHPHRFAEQAREIEFSRMGITCGFQDFYATTFGGMTYLDFRGKQHWRGPEVDPFATVEPLLDVSEELPLVLANTGRQRDSGATHRPLRARWLEGDEAVRAAMRALTAAARETKRHVLDRDWPAVGEAMNGAHRRVAAIGASGGAVDALTALARRLGARGAKLAGAGLGGTIIALHDDPPWLARELTARGAASAFPLRHAAAGARLEPPDIRPARQPQRARHSLEPPAAACVGRAAGSSTGDGHPSPPPASAGNAAASAAAGGAAVPSAAWRRGEGSPPPPRVRDTGDSTTRPSAAAPLPRAAHS